VVRPRERRRRDAGSVPIIPASQALIARLGQPATVSAPHGPFSVRSCHEFRARRRHARSPAPSARISQSRGAAPLAGPMGSDAAARNRLHALAGALRATMPANIPHRACRTPFQRRGMAANHRCEADRFKKPRRNGPGSGPLTPCQALDRASTRISRGAHVHLALGPV